MKDVRLQVNEDLMDTQAARIEELERRLDALLVLLRRDSVCQALGLKAFEFDRANPNEIALRLQPMKHFHERHRAIEARQQKKVLTQLSRVSPERLEELLRGR